MRLGDLDALKKAFEVTQYNDYDDLERTESLIDNAPTVRNEYMRGYEAAEREYKRPQGEWITVHFRPEELNVPQKASMFDFVKCPFCETIHQGRHNFCSRCGADMRKGGAV